MENEWEMQGNMRCFLISPMGKPDSETRNFADKVRSFLEKEVVNPLGFGLFRSDDINESGMIRDDMIGHIIDDDLVITLLDYENVNVYYELAVRHSSGKVCFVIMADTDSEKRSSPFDSKDVRLIIFPRKEMENYIPGKLTSGLTQFKGKLKGDIQAYLSHNYKIKNPVLHARQEFKLPPEVTADDLMSNVDKRLSQFQVTLSDRISTMENQLSKLNPEEIMNTLNEINDRGIATYIDGEDSAFDKLAEVTEMAKVSLRTSRFAPQAIGETKTRFFNAFCNFGKQKGVTCKRIMCMNQSVFEEKRQDLWKTISYTCGGSMQLYLTKRDNNFELVVVDNFAAFLHFYDDDRRIKSTLFVKGQPVITEFTKIYDRMLSDPFYHFQVIDCSKHKFVYEFADEVEEALLNLDKYETVP